jgi:predicted GNAT family N-acyltransferase
VTASTTASASAVLPPFEVRIARTPAELDAIVALRARVFRDEQHIVDDELTDPDDIGGVHAYVAADGRVISAGRLAPPTVLRREGLIAWVATLPEYRRRGVAEAVMLTLLEVADRRRAPSIVISAQTHALAFYRRLGFVAYGSRFQVRGIEHQHMERRVL